MSSISVLHDDLLATQAAIEQAKRAIASNPTRLSLSATLRSLESRQRNLESQFLAETDSVGLDVCSYRMFSEDPKRKDPAILSVANILAAFQGLFTLAYDAVRHGPKSRAVVSHDVADLTSFGFGYAFSGSTGIVMTVPRSRLGLLFEDDAVPRSAEAIFQMLRADSPRAVRQASSAFGPAVVRAVLKLSDAHVKSKTGADIDWREGDRVIGSGVFQAPQFDRLRTAIRATSDEFTERFPVTGRLVGARIGKKTFDFEEDDGEEFSGTFDDAIDDSHTVELPKRYKAVIVKTTKVQFSTEVEQASYFLESLDGPLPD